MQNMGGFSYFSINLPFIIPVLEAMFHIMAIIALFKAIKALDIYIKKIKMVGLLRVKLS